MATAAGDKTRKERRNCVHHAENIGVENFIQYIPVLAVLRSYCRMAADSGIRDDDIDRFLIVPSGQSMVHPRGVNDVESLKPQIRAERATVVRSSFKTSLIAG